MTPDVNPLNQSQVTNIVLSALIDVYKQMGLETIPLPDNQTILFGRGSKLDSLGLVNLIVEVEEAINKHVSRPITLADERAMVQENSPFRSVATLSSYIMTLLDEQPR